MPRLRSAPRLAAASVVAALTIAARTSGGAPDRLKEVSAQIAKEPANPRLLIRRAALHRQRGDFDSALADLDLAAGLPGGKVEADVAAAEILLQRGDAAGAVKLT